MTHATQYRLSNPGTGPVPFELCRIGTAYSPQGRHALSAVAHPKVHVGNEIRDEDAEADERQKAG
jgi:hypothetical protein